MRFADPPCGGSAPFFSEIIVINNVHFISGLPRSGSTLLSALLKQNPRFLSGMTSPVAALCNSVHRKTCAGEFSSFFDNARRSTMLRGIFDSYYAHAAPDQVVFDTNRTWTGRAALISSIYPGARIICCVRDLGWIIDSMEKMLVKNPLQLSKIFSFQPGTSVYARAELLMNMENGLIGHPWANLREAWFGDFAARLIVVQYDSLARDPAATLERLYQAIGEPLFAHDFERVVFDEPEYDAEMGMPGLHKVREKVQLSERKLCIPPDLFAKHASASFWNKAELNARGVQVI